MRRAIITTADAVFAWSVEEGQCEQRAYGSGSEHSRLATGDTFAAVMAAGLSRGLTLRDATRLATAGTAIFVRDGKIPAWPRLKSLAAELPLREKHSAAAESAMHRSPLAAAASVAAALGSGLAAILSAAPR